jgi:cytochrome c oxidase assembly protein subunit 15
MVEWVNRMVNGLVSICVLVAVVAAYRRTPRRRDLVRLSWGLVAGVAGQVALGAVTVAYDLAPPLVMGHMLLSLLLVTDAAVLLHRAGEPDGVRPTWHVSDGARRLLLVLVPALSAAVVAGTIVTGSGPHGGDEAAPRFGFDIETVARIHSIAVIVFLGVLLAVLNRLVREKAPLVVVERARQLIYVAVAQAAVGWIQYFTDVPALLVGVHITGATLVWLALWRLLLSARSVDVPVAPATDAAPSSPLAVA